MKEMVLIKSSYWSEICKINVAQVSYTQQVEPGDGFKDHYVRCPWDTLTSYWMVWLQMPWGQKYFHKYNFRIISLIHQKYYITF